MACSIGTYPIVFDVFKVLEIIRCTELLPEGILPILFDLLEEPFTRQIHDLTLPQPHGSALPFFPLYRRLYEKSPAIVNYLAINLSVSSTYTLILRHSSLSGSVVDEWVIQSVSRLAQNMTPVSLGYVRPESSLDLYVEPAANDELAFDWVASLPHRRLPALAVGESLDLLILSTKAVTMSGSVTLSVGFVEDLGTTRSVGAESSGIDEIKFATDHWGSSEVLNNRTHILSREVLQFSDEGWTRATIPPKPNLKLNPFTRKQALNPELL